MAVVQEELVALKLMASYWKTMVVADQAEHEGLEVCNEWNREDELV